MSGDAEEGLVVAVEPVEVVAGAGAGALRAFRGCRVRGGLRGPRHRPGRESRPGFATDGDSRGLLGRPREEKITPVIALPVHLLEKWGGNGGKSKEST